MSCPWKLVELCAGSASLTYHMLGARGYQIVPFQGSKWRFRKPLAAHLAAAGFTGPPAIVELSDPSFWGTAHLDILTPWRRARVIAHLRRLDKLEPRAAYDALNRAEAATTKGWASAQFLFLQRLAFSGKAVGTDDGRWKPQGFNPTSAYGLAASDTFKEVKPQVRHLIRVLKRLNLTPAEHRSRRGPARIPDRFQWRTAAFLDPPYRGTTGYPDGSMGRAEVVELAMSWHAAGAHVLVSEGEAIPELVEAGWSAAKLQKPKPRSNAPFKSKHAEWLTVSPHHRRA